MATACLRLLTFLPLPDFRVPSLCSFMTLWTLLLAVERGDDVLVAMASPGRVRSALAATGGRPLGRRFAGGGFAARGGSRGRVGPAVGFRHHRMFGIRRNAVFQQFILAG